MLIPGSLGAVGAILVANFFPRRQKTVLAVSGAALLAGAIALAIRLARTPGETLSRDWLGGLLSRLAFSQHPLCRAGGCRPGWSPRPRGTGRPGCST